jgi:hypothetical protein
MKKSKSDATSLGAQAAGAPLITYAGQLDAKVGNPLALDAASLRAALSKASGVDEDKVSIAIEAVHDGSAWRTRVITRIDI